jgi:hypothetical protein
MLSYPGSNIVQELAQNRLYYTLMDLWIFALPFLALVAFVGGVYLIIKRRHAPWYLWTGIALVGLFAISLPVTVPITFLLLLLLTGGSFS